MELYQKIRNYYLDNFNNLPLEKQFHFANRLASWNNDKECQSLVRQIKPKIVKSDEHLKSYLKQLIAKPISGATNASALRQPYFQAYPELRGLMNALFKIRHCLFIYGVDQRPTLLELISLEDLHALSQKLLKDKAALKILSTYAVNYLYLVEKILFPEKSHYLKSSEFLNLKENYNLENYEEMQLLIYLYTHCIIGESNFYMRKVEDKDYIKMLIILEHSIREHFDNVHLDNKLEFLVCSKIYDYKTNLIDRIFAECEKSLSPDGTYLIDVLSNFKQTEKITFEASEHRNVLYIMASQDFTP